MGLTLRIAARLLQSLAVLVAMSLLVHALMGLMPGDPIDLMIAADPHLGSADAARLKALYGLDRPWWERWLRWVAQLAQGELGYSRLEARPVGAALAPAVVNTLTLMGVSLATALAIALPLGLIAARRPGGPADLLVNLLAFASVSVPVFWLGVMLIALFAVGLGWLPAGGIATLGGGGPADRLAHLVLPATTLALAGLGPYARHMRAAMITEAGRDYVRTAKAKGCSPWRIVLRHQMRNAALPVVAVLGMDLGALLSGALVTETVFAWPGMGRLIYDSVMGNDFNLALCGLMVATAATLTGSILADLAQIALDPRGGDRDGAGR